MNKTFGSEIRMGRECARLNQKQLAAYLGISPQYLNDIEQGKRNPPGYYLTAKLAKALSFDEDYLNFMAGRWPEDLTVAASWISAAKFEEAYAAFKKVLYGKEETTGQ